VGRNGNLLAGRARGRGTDLADRKAAARRKRRSLAGRPGRVCILAAKPRHTRAVRTHLADHFFSLTEPKEAIEIFRGTTIPPARAGHLAKREDSRTHPPYPKTQHLVILITTLSVTLTPAEHQFNAHTTV
jgi:hypothetical protein